MAAKHIQSALPLDPQPLISSDSESDAYLPLYNFIEQYAAERGLKNTLIALPLVQEIMRCEGVNMPDEYKDSSEYAADFQHCLSVVNMLINLHITLSPEEEDILLSSAICHILPENIDYRASENWLTKEYDLNPKIHNIIMLLYHKSELSESEEQKYYGRIQNDRLALLIALADRGNLMGQLYDLSSWSARRYIYETRNNFFPMCIYAKENYTDLLPYINTLTEKMKCLIEIAEILLSRYESRETELMQEILQLQEDNARLKGLIKMYSHK